MLRHAPAARSRTRVRTEMLHVLKWLTRRRLAALAFAPVVAGLAADPTLVQSLGLDVWNYRALEREAAEAEAAGRDLTAEAVDVNQRIELKEALIGDLIAGRTTLAEVTTQFAALNEPRPHYQEVIRTHFPGRTDKEKLARSVIEYARPRITDAAEDQVMARLEAELAEMADPTEPAAGAD